MEDYTNKTEEDLLEILEDLNEQQEMFEEDLDDRDYKMMYDKNAQEIIKINAALSELNTDAPVEQDLESRYNPSGADSPPAEEFVETVEEQDLESRYNPSGADSPPAEEFVETVEEQDLESRYNPSGADSPPAEEFEETVEEIETKPIEIKQVSQENLDNIKFSDIKVDNSLFFAKGGAIYEGDKVKIKDSGTTMKVTDISKNKKDQVEFSGEKGSYLIGDIEKMAKGGEVIFTDLKDNTSSRKIWESKKSSNGQKSFGAFAHKIDKKYIGDYYLYKLDDYDEKFYSHIPLKDGEMLARVQTDNMVSGEMPLVKINIKNGRVYFMSEDNDLNSDYDDKNPKFNRASANVVFLSLDKAIKDYAKGGETSEYGWDSGEYYWDVQLEDNNNKLRRIAEFESKSFDEIRGEHRLNRNKSDKELYDEMERLREMKGELQAENLHLYDNFGGEKEYLKWKTDKKAQEKSKELPFEKGGSVRRTNISPLLRYTNFEDGWIFNLVKLNPLRNQDGLKYKGNYKYGISRQGPGKNQEVWQYATLEEANKKYDELIELGKTYSKIKTKGNISKNYAKGGTIDKNLTYKGEVVGFKGDDTGGAVLLGDIDIPKNSTPKSIIELAKSKFKRTWYVEVSKDGEYLYEIADDSYKGEYPMVTAYAKGGELNKGDVVRQTGKFAESGDYYVVEKDKGNKDEEAENYYQLSEVRKKEQGWFEESDLEKLYAKGGEINIADLKKGDYVQKKGSNIALEVISIEKDKYSDYDVVELYDDVLDRTQRLINLSEYEMSDRYDLYTPSYAKGGETDSPITNYKKNIMGTTSFDLKVKGMRKPQDFIVYPITEKTDKIRIQSDKKFGEIHLPTGKGILSKSGNTSWHLASDMMNRNVNTFELSEAELQEFINQIKSTSGKSVGSSFVKSDNSGARLLEDGGKLDMNEVDIYQGLDGDYTIVMHGDVYEMNHHTMPNMSIDMYAGNRAEFPADISHWGKTITYEKAPIVIKNKIEKRAEEYNKQFAKGGEVSDKRQRVAEFLVVMDYDNGFYDEELDREYGSVTPEEAIEWELKNRVKTDEDADYYLDEDGDLVMEKGGKVDLKKFDKEIAEQIDILESMIKEEKDEGLRKELMEEIEKMKKVL